jgi:hypothetical protein
MAASTKDLVDRARFLRNAAPEPYVNFLRELKSYTDDVTYALIYATENIQVAQGHAQQCLKLTEALEEVTKHG